MYILVERENKHSEKSVYLMVINVMKNNLAECGEHIMIVERTILHFLVRKGLTEKVIFKQ